MRKAPGFGRVSRVLVIVNTAPWASSLAGTAARFTQAACRAGLAVTVFFHGDGVYNAVGGQLSDDGVPGPQSEWRRLAAECGVDLVLCPAASARRLSAADLERLPSMFRQAGLTHVLERAAQQACRMVHF